MIFTGYQYGYLTAQARKLVDAWIERETPKWRYPGGVLSVELLDEDGRHLQIVVCRVNAEGRRFADPERPDEVATQTLQIYARTPFPVGAFRSVRSSIADPG